MGIIKAAKLAFDYLRYEEEGEEPEVNRDIEKVDYDSEQKISKVVQPNLSELNDPKTVGDFLNSITSIAFAELLEEFGFEMQLIIFLMYRGYCAKEVSKITGIPEWTICRRLAKLDYTYKIRKTNK